MDYIEATNNTLAIGAVVGLCVGLSVTGQGIAKTRNTENWRGWDAAISQAIALTIVWILLFGASAFLLLIYNPQKSFSEINRVITVCGLVIGLLLPTTVQLVNWAVKKVNVD